jgi:hypothetical protein
MPALAWLLALCSAINASAQVDTRAATETPKATLHGHVQDENRLPVADAEVVIVSPEGRPLIVFSDAAGNFEVEGLNPGVFHASVTKLGFFLLKSREFELKQGSNDISFTLSHEYEVRDSVEVVGTVEQISPEQTDQQETLQAHDIVDMPLPGTHDLKTYLPSMPGVVRDHSGGLHVAGGRGEQTEYLLDGFDIADPATRLLSSRLNVDAVRSVDVDTGGYGAQYSHGGAGVLALNTPTGDDHWRFGTTNFIPGVTHQKGWNLGNWYPRVNFSGPLRRGVAWFSDSMSLQRTLGVIAELPQGSDTRTEWAGDNLLRVQYNLTPRHILQVESLINELSDFNLGLSALTPISTTIDRRYSQYFVSLKDQITFAGGLLELGLAFDRGHNQTLPQGSQPYVVSPTGASGNYFEQLDQRTHRVQSFGNLILPSRSWHGSHNLSLGFNADNVAFAQDASRGTIASLDAAGIPRLLTTFTGAAGLDISNTQAGGYAQDSWRPAHMLVIQAGVRADWNRIIGQAVVAPTIAVNYIPFKDDRAKLTLAWGIYYEPLNLSLLALGHDQSRLDLVNSTDTVTPALEGPFTTRFILPGGFRQPRFETASAGWKERVGASTFLTIRGILRRERDGLTYQFFPTEAAFGGDLLLQNNRGDQYRSIEFSIRRSFGSAEVFADYTWSRARSNQALEYTLGNPLFVPQLPGALSWDAPNRFLSYGWVPTRLWSLLLSYHFEYRTGSPFGLFNSYRQLVTAPDLYRFPSYLSLDVGMEKRFHFRRHEWALRLTVVNVTDHQNPDTVANIAGSPIIFAGGQGRAFTARLRLVGKK